MFKKGRLILALIVCVTTIGTFSLMGCKTETPVTETTAATEAETATTTTTETAEEFLVTMMPAHLVSPFYVVMIDAAQKAAEKYPNIVLDVKGPTAEPGLEEQIAMLEDVLQKNVGLIGITSEGWDAVTPLLQKAIDKGTEVALLDMDSHIEGVNAITAIGVDQIKGGEAGGEYVAKLLNGKGRIVILEGVTGDYWSVRRVQGFRNIIDQYPDIEIVTIQPAEWAREKGLAVMENILQSHPDIDLVWALNGNMALGALKAIEDAGLQEKIMVVGMNGDKEEIESIMKGGEKATVGQNPVGLGTSFIEEVAVKLIEGKKAEVPKLIPIPVTMITKDNAEEMMKVLYP